MAAELGVVVDLAVEGEDEAAVGRHHRLVARGRQVDDRQPSVTKTNTGIGVDPNAAIIGSAVGDRLDQPSYSGFVDPRFADQPSYAAHGGFNTSIGYLARRAPLFDAMDAGKQRKGILIKIERNLGAAV